MRVQEAAPMKYPPRKLAKIHIAIGSAEGTVAVPLAIFPIALIRTPRRPDLLARHSASRQRPQRHACVGAVFRNTNPIQHSPPVRPSPREKGTKVAPVARQLIAGNGGEDALALPFAAHELTDVEPIARDQSTAPVRRTIDYLAAVRRAIRVGTTGVPPQVAVAHALFRRRLFLFHRRPHRSGHILCVRQPHAHGVLLGHYLQMQARRLAARHTLDGNSSAFTSSICHLHLMPPPSPHTTTARVGSTTTAARGREILRENRAGTVSDDTNISILCCDLRRRAAATQDSEGVAEVARAARHTHAGVADVVEWTVAGGARGVVRRPPW
mmetsp:Transcript_95027/g.153280  ORF Transcript_95027/g.153280 Transcript_95027/m.153280 type:complete len:326 (-) Transcript_95027:1040-2017(-)